MSMLPAQQVALADHKHRVTVDSIDGSVYGGTPTSIDPDDTAAAGTAATVAHSDHQHACPCGTPDALTKTAVSAENNGATFARNNHTHATSALPWGIVPSGRFSSTGNDSARAAGVTTDMTVTVALTANRLYKVTLNTGLALGTAAAVYAEELVHDGTVVGRFARQVPAETAVGSTTHWVGTTVDYVPASDDASATLAVQNAAGSGGTITAQPPTTGPRTLTVTDCGPVT